MQVPEPLELIERIKSAMNEPHNEWKRTVPHRAGVATRALSRCMWEMGFDYEGVYPTAHDLGDDAEDVAIRRLSDRGANFSKAAAGHSPLGEFQYDIAWLEYDAEYTDDEVPRFKRLVLALESEFKNEWEVLLDFHKLLCTRAGLRVMVWDAKSFPGGYEALASRLGAAGDWAEGHWLLSAWDDNGGFTHAAHDGTTRLK